MVVNHALADPRRFLRGLFEAAVDRALPSRVLPAFLPTPPKGRTVVIGAGKAAAAMAQAVEAAWPSDASLGGVVVTRYGHIPPRAIGLPHRIEVLEAAHPVPDQAGVRAAQRMLAALSSLTPDDLVLCLMSGGASALLTLPVAGLDLALKQKINRQLLASGAPIGEMNCVRKHLSAIKGGQLARACRPARLVTLAISDVPGDDLAVIGSGPSVPDPTTCREALDILQRHRIDLPEPLRRALADGLLETAKPGEDCFARAEAHVIAAPWASLEAAAEAARAQGIRAYILGDALEGESRDLACALGPMALAVAHRGQPFEAPCVLLSGGETTVTFSNDDRPIRPGRGGRAGEFCMGLAHALQGHSSIWALAADTDGIDGIEDNAGAIVAPDTLERARLAGLDMLDCLDRHDAYGFFSELNDLVCTGPTFTNVNDFRAILVC